ncbi:MAG: 50S ribosomal protein L10 [Aigarchaeota archaeon]|nr:50S ribosomal protein L10 [Aigarchaeota archaeon]MCX8203457.1 50S ribosomal protein L10 [Nitrososphaeria archaeon]MDW8043431.1 50S ribosomal protein L10 [Nitrososphaerota archaeon]
MSATALLRPRERKSREIELLARLMSANPVVMVLDLTKTSANVLHSFRGKVRGIATVRVTKKNLAVKAAERVGRRALVELLSGLRHPVGLVFSAKNPFLLKLDVDASRILTPPKAGEVADIDVTVPEMNTGIPPGPILSEFGKLRIPTKIEGGTIWIARETVVAKRGDAISPALASLLSKLDIPAVYRGLNVVAAVDGETVIHGDQLALDLEAVRRDVASCHSSARALLIELGIPEPEVIADLLAVAHTRAMRVAAESGYVTPETVALVFQRAEAQARALAAAIGQ